MTRIIKLLSARLQVKCILLSILAAIGAYFVSLIPISLGKILDGISSQTIQELLLSVISFAVLFLLTETMNICRRVSTDRVCVRFEEDLRNNIISKLLRLPLRDLLANGVSGELTSKINQGVSGTSQLMKMLPNDLLPAIFVGVFVVIQCIEQAPPIVAIVMFVYIICTLSVSLFQIKSQRGIRDEIIQKKTKLDGDICQSITGIEQIRSLGAEDAESTRLAPQTKGIRVTECKHHTIMGVFDVIKQIVKVTFFAGLLLIGIILVGKGRMSSGSVLSITLLFQQLLKPIDEFTRILDEISSCSRKMVALKEILLLSSDNAFKITDSKEHPTTNDICIKNYEVLSPGEDKVISKCTNMVFSVGHCTAVVGKTGGGKSSLMKGLIRLYPLKGIVSLFGMDLSATSQNLLTKLIHYIPQTPFFFAGTVRDNLSYALERTPDDSELLFALRQACIYYELAAVAHDFVTPLDYFIQENGKNLSGGELKRLAIARAFLRTPKIFVLDETLANIDEQTMEKILGNFEAYVRKIGAGIVHISHDQKIVRRCDATVRLGSVQ